MDLRAAWESELRKQFHVDPDTDCEVLDFLWGEVTRDYADKIREGDSEVLEDMVARAELPCVTHVRFSRGGNGGRGLGSNNAGSGHDLSGQIGFDSKTKTHVKALSEYLSKIAAVEPRVMEFRRRHLGGSTKTVTLDEVPRLLEAWSIDPGAESEDDVSLYWTVEERRTRFRGSYWSAIGMLERLCHYLAKKYPWGINQVLHFVLSGGPWQVNTVLGKRSNSKGVGPAAHKFDRYTITLEVEAWVPPELVKKAYAKFQRDSKVGELTGEATTTRRSYGRKAEVFRFVVEQAEIAVISEKENLGKLVLPDSWRELRKLWDDHLPTDHAWKYGENGWRNFQRDFKRGQEAVIGNEYGLPGVPAQPRTAEQVQESLKSFWRAPSSEWGAVIDVY